MTTVEEQREYWIKEFRMVKPNELVSDEIRSKKNEDAENFSGLKESIKNFTMVSPIIAREDGKRLKLVDGHRRLKAIKEIGVEDIPVNIVQASDEEAKKAAFISNVIRMKLQPDDLSKTLLDIYAKAGYSNNDKVITYLLELNASRHTVPKKFLETMKSIGLSHHQQLRYLKADRDLHPESKRIMYANEGGTKVRPQVNKAFLLTSEKMRKDPKIQSATARHIRDIPYKEAQEFVNEVNEGEINPIEEKVDSKRTLDRIKLRTQFRTEPRKGPKPAFEGDPILDVIPIIGQLESYLTSHKSPDLSDETIDETRNFRIKVASQEKYDVVTLTKYFNHLEFLIDLMKDMASILERTIKEKKAKDELLRK